MQRPGYPPRLEDLTLKLRRFKTLHLGPGCRRRKHPPFMKEIQTRSEEGE